MILDQYVHGKQSIGSRLTGELLVKVALVALMLYGTLKGQSFLFGILHKSGLPVPLGTPGNILSSGLILPLNILVGVVVGAAFYLMALLFEEGRI